MFHCNPRYPEIDYCDELNSAFSDDDVSIIRNIYFLYLLVLTRYLYIISLSQFELQWMVIHCDPSWPDRDNCDEIPVRLSTLG